MTDPAAFEGELLRMESALGLPAEREAGPAAGRPVVLVVDDDPRVLETLREVLGGRYRVQVFSSGEDLRSRWSGEGDAAVLDIKMPEEDGLSVFRELRRRAPRMSVIFFTAYPGDEEVAARARALGPAAFLGKGCPLADLLDVLGAATRRHAESQEGSRHV
ncbi:MAG: response regulator [Nitrospinota bacterium]